MPRGGTTFLLRRLHQHPDVMGFGESRFFGNDWVEPEAEGLLRADQVELVGRRLAANPLNSNLPNPDDPPGRAGWIDHLDAVSAQERLAELFAARSGPITPGDLFREVCATLVEGSGANTVVEKTPQHLRHVDRVLAQVPDAKILVVLRDPYDFLLSYKHAGARRSEERREVDEMLWQATGVSLLWRSYYRAAAAAEARFGDRIKVVRLEDVSADPQASFREILDFLELVQYDVLEGAPERDNSSFSAERPSLEDSDVAAFNTVARRDAERAGYAVRPSGLGPLRSAYASAGVIPWAVRNARAANQRTDGGLWRYARAAVLRRGGS
jgi:hypothetical protein